MSLRAAALACHALLMLTLAAAVLAPGPSGASLAFATVLLAPLLLALPGLRAGRRPVVQRLAVLLVLYIGGTSMEVVARSGAMPLVNVALLAATLELGVLLALIRGSSARPRDARE